MTAYHLAFLTAALFALVAAGFSLTIHDSDAAETIVRRPPRRTLARPTPRTTSPVPQGADASAPLNVCVFCGSSPGASPTFAVAARRLGAGLAGRGIGLVYGGASVGLMGVVADAALAAVGGRRA